MTNTTLAPFTVTAHGFFRRVEIPPRCRKPRPVQYDTSASVDIARVTGDQAPVAFSWTEAIDGERVVRTFGGLLYAPYLPWAHQSEPSLPGSEHFPAEVADHDTWHHSYAASNAEEFAANVASCFNDFLIIDEVVWIRTGEPRYVVMTFGLGHNHGGTGLLTSAYDNCNIAASSYFRADEFASAREHALEVAENRGDTDSVTVIERMSPIITVHIPDAVRLIPGTDEPEVRPREDR